MHRYVVHALAGIWQEHGHEVFYLFGTRRWQPADLILVHVNLSVVPEAYLAFARRYPIALNAHVSDIRKSACSSALLKPGERSDGPVMLKSDLNCGGRPEARLLHGRLRRAFQRLTARHDEDRGDYRVFPNADAIPPALRRRPDRVIERFLPEREGDLYVVRHYQFLGDRATAMKLKGREPVVKGRTLIASEPIEPDPAIVALRQRMQFDYGKFDYVMHDGESFLLDANKTTGADALPQTPELMEMRRFRAEGLYWYFRQTER